MSAFVHKRLVLQTVLLGLLCRPLKKDRPDWKRVFRKASQFAPYINCDHLALALTEMWLVS